MANNINSFPKVIEIQFHNGCNSYCLICPYKDMNYKYIEMKEEVFEKFLKELPNDKLIRIIPYLNNEPFLDNKYIEKLKKIRNKCLKTEIEISTNASVLTPNVIQELSKLNITEFRLSVFGYSEETYKRMMPRLNRDKVFNNLKEISNYFKETETIVSIVMIDDGSIDENEFKNMNILAKELGFAFERWGFLDRCKNVTYKSNEIYKDRIYGCEQNRPIERMHILANGDVIFCCQDWSHSIIIGNISNNSIQEIWNCAEYNNLRKKLYGKDEESPELCKNCKLALSI